MIFKDRPSLPFDSAYDIIADYFDNIRDVPRLTPREFYRLVFPSGELETQDERDNRAKGRYGAIIYKINTDGEHNNVRRYTMTDDLDVLDNVLDTDDFLICAPISFAGTSAKAQNARSLYALVFDLDQIYYAANRPEGLIQVFYQIESDICPAYYRLPMPTAVVSSGSGIHLYYVLDAPLRLYPNIVKQLREMRYQLTSKIWKDASGAQQTQYEGVFQQYRMVGSVTKQGKRVIAWQTGEPVSIAYLNKFVNELGMVDAAASTNRTSLEVAKQKWPRWYENRIEKKRPPQTWTCNRRLYDWWLKKAVEAEPGHRYFAMMCLAIYAIKSGVAYDELKEDMYKLAVSLDVSSPKDGSNNITDIDIKDALKAYADNYITFPIHSIMSLTNIRIEKNKRNGRPQEKHLVIARGIRDLRGKLGEKVSGGGRPKGSGIKKEIIKSWRKAHPDGKKIDCEHDTGLSRPTILKWWDN